MELYRYLPFETFIDIVQTNKLTFLSPLLWEDKFEGPLYRALKSKEGQFAIYNILKKIGINFFPSSEAAYILLSEMLKIVRCQCWSKSRDSVAMWSIYPYSNKAIMIKVNDENLKNLSNGNTNVQLYEIEYYNKIDFEEEIKKAFTSKTTLKPSMLFCSKREAFKHEAEIRAFTAVPPGPDYTTTIKSPMRLNIELPINEFIEEVLVHPSSPDWFVNIVRDTCNIHKLNFSGKSSLFEFHL